MSKRPSTSRRKVARKVTYVTLFADESLNPKYEAALKRLEENLGASNVELSPDDLKQIDTAFSAIHVQGERYPEALQKLVGR